MLNEKKLSTAQMKGIQGAFPGAQIVKTNDRSTIGIPDIYANALEHTFWWENKYLRKGKRYKDILDVNQLLFCMQTSATTGKCWVTIFEDDPVQTTVWLPRQLMMCVFPSALFGHTPLHKHHDLEDTLGDDNLAMLVKNCGSIRIPGKHFTGICARLMKDYIRAQG